MTRGLSAWPRPTEFARVITRPNSWAQASFDRCNTIRRHDPPWVSFIGPCYATPRLPVVANRFSFRRTEQERGRDLRPAVQPPAYALQRGARWQRGYGEREHACDRLPRSSAADHGLPVLPPAPHAALPVPGRSKARESREPAAGAVRWLVGCTTAPHHRTQLHIGENFASQTLRGPRQSMPPRSAQDILRLEVADRRYRLCILQLSGRAVLPRHADVRSMNS